MNDGSFELGGYKFRSNFYKLLARDVHYVYSTNYCKKNGDYFSIRTPPPPLGEGMRVAEILPPSITVLSALWFQVISSKRDSYLACTPTLAWG